MVVVGGSCIVHMHYCICTGCKSLHSALSLTKFSPVLYITSSLMYVSMVQVKRYLHYFVKSRATHSRNSA